MIGDLAYFVVAIVKRSPARAVMQQISTDPVTPFDSSRGIPYRIRIGDERGEVGAPVLLLRQPDGPSFQDAGTSADGGAARGSVMARSIFFGIAALISALSACSYGKGAPYAEEGRLFPWKKVTLVHKGMTADQVRDVLGDPFEVKAQDGAEVWRYYVQERQDEHIYVLGLIPTKKTMYRGRAEVTVEFEQNAVSTVVARTPESQANR